MGVWGTVNNILIEALGIIADQVHETIRKCQATSIKVANANGKNLIRPVLAFPVNSDKDYAYCKAKEITAKTSVEMTDTIRTIFELISIMEEE